LTPRGQLHNETVYGSHKEYVVKEETVNAKFDSKKIGTVVNPAFRLALTKRLQQFNDDPKKAFSGANALSKKPIWLDELHTNQAPEKVKTMSFETVYTIRKEISPDLKVDKVVDKKSDKTRDSIERVWRKCQAGILQFRRKSYLAQSGKRYFHKACYYLWR
jgi:CRISPR-associated endonuclease Csn1